MVVVAAQASAERLGLPRGTSLSDEVWRRRHRAILLVLGAHAVALVGYGLYMAMPPWHVLAEGAIVAGLAALAAWPRLDRRTASVVASFGLMSSSAVLVHFSGGYIEAHFHFFVMLGIIFLYEDWVPYSLAALYVSVHHGVAGTLDPTSVYNHPSAIVAPWRWALIHAAFIAGLSACLLVAWNVIDRARRSETRAVEEAEQVKRQLHAQEKMAALGSLVAGLAHEVRTPLTVVSTSASLIEMQARRAPEPVSARVLEQAREIQVNVDRIKGLVSQLRRFHALSPDDRRTTTLDAAVKEAMTLFASVNRAGATLQLDLVETRPTLLDPLGVQQVVLNLVANAMDAVDPARGLVVVRTRDGDGRVVLVVEDNGSGIPYEDQARVFDPLFTTKKDGMGLGLHIVKRIVDAHGGTIGLSSAPGQGTRFTITFPVVERETHVPVDTGEPAAPRATA